MQILAQAKADSIQKLDEAIGSVSKVTQQRTYQNVW